MKKILAAVLCAALAVPATALPVSAASDELVLFTWENMFPQEVLDGLRKRQE